MDETLRRIAQQKQNSRRDDFSGVLNPNFVTGGTVGEELEQKRPMSAESVPLPPSVSGVDFRADVLALINSIYPLKIGIADVKKRLNSQYPLVSLAQFGETLNTLSANGQITRHFSSGTYSGRAKATVDQAKQPAPENGKLDPAMHDLHEMREPIGLKSDPTPTDQLPELLAMRLVFNALKSLSKDEQGRVLQWISDVLASERVIDTK